MLKSNRQLGPQLVPVSSGSGTFTVTTDAGEVRTFYVTVDPVATSISFKPALPTVIVGQTLSVIATVLDKNGQAQFNRSVKWESLNPTEFAVVADNNNVAQLVGLTVPTTNTPVKVRVSVVDDPTITQELNVFIRGRDQVLEFELLDIRLDLFDPLSGSFAAWVRLPEPPLFLAFFITRHEWDMVFSQRILLLLARIQRY